MRTSSIQFSQNFLHSPSLVKKLIAKTNITEEDTVYDIGSGKGIIAAALAEKCKQVVCFELDRDLSIKLRENLKPYPNITIHQANFLTITLPDRPYKVFANIPFNLSADIVRKLTSAQLPPAACYLIVQREFANKLVSKPGKYNSQLAIVLGVRFRIRTIHQLRPNDFYPAPRVATVLLEISPRNKPLISTEYIQLFQDFIAYAYNAFQPSLGVTLAPIFSPQTFLQLAESIGFEVTAKPSQLDITRWVQLFTAALSHKAYLTKLVNNYEAILAQRHKKHTKLNRTRRDAHHS